MILKGLGDWAIKWSKQPSLTRRHLLDRQTDGCLISMDCIA